MDVVRHHDPRAEMVEAPLVGADQDGVRNQIGNPPVIEPYWAGSDPINATVGRRNDQESGAARIFLFREVASPINAK